MSAYPIAGIMRWHQFMSKIKKTFPKRKPAAHKGDFGKALIVAGSEGMLGAAVLASRAALRAGAGLVYLQVPQSLRDIANLFTPEVIITGDIPPALTAIAIGPGLGKYKSTIPKFLSKLARQKFTYPVIIDADGLNALVGKTELIKNSALNLILTPHPGEMARLLNSSVREIQNDRKKTAQQAAVKFNCIVVLKGHNTVIADPSGNIYINKTGNPGMASAGVGDVLTGLIAGLAAQGFSAWDAAKLGVYFHGMAGDLAAREMGEAGMIASDIIEKIPYAIQKNS